MTSVNDYRAQAHTFLAAASTTAIAACTEAIRLDRAAWRSCAGASHAIPGPGVLVRRRPPQFLPAGAPPASTDRFEQAIADFSMASGSTRRTPRPRQPGRVLGGGRHALAVADTPRPSGSIPITLALRRAGPRLQASTGAGRRRSERGRPPNPKEPNHQVSRVNALEEGAVDQVLARTDRSDPHEIRPTAWPTPCGPRPQRHGAVDRAIPARTSDPAKPWPVSRIPAPAVMGICSAAPQPGADRTRGCSTFLMILPSAPVPGLSGGFA